MTKTTLQLAPGDRVLLVGRHVRTVETVEPGPFVNQWGAPIFNVLWAEGSTSEWSAGNSGAAETVWTVTA